VAENRRLPLDSQLCHRAIADWYLTRHGVHDLPAGGGYVAAYLCQHEGTRYAVVTTSCAGSTSRGVQVLAVYLIRRNGALVRLSKWPEEVEPY
jgi:hypothetical protein